MTVMDTHKFWTFENTFWDNKVSEICGRKSNKKQNTLVISQKHQQLKDNRNVITLNLCCLESPLYISNIQDFNRQSLLNCASKERPAEKGFRFTFGSGLKTLISNQLWIYCEMAQETLCNPKPTKSWLRVRQTVSSLHTHAAMSHQRLVNKTKPRRQMNIHDMTFQGAHHGGSQWLCI